MQPWMSRSAQHWLAVQLKIFVTDTSSWAPASTMLMKLLTPDGTCAKQVWLSSASWRWPQNLWHGHKLRFCCIMRGCWGSFDMWTCRHLLKTILKPVQFSQIFKMIILAAIGPRKLFSRDIIGLSEIFRSPIWTFEVWKTCPSCSACNFATVDIFRCKFGQV